MVSFEELHLLSLQELDDLYYRLHEQGSGLVQLKNVRMVQESKLQLLPVKERESMTKQIQDRYKKSMLAPSAKRLMRGEQTT